MGVEPNLKFAFELAVIVISVCHLYGHVFVVGIEKRWRAVDTNHGISLKYANIAFIGATLLSHCLLLVGNLVDPGRWSVAFNVIVTGICGTFFVWMPFTVPLIMFFFEIHSHIIDMDFYYRAIKAVTRYGDGIPLDVEMF